MAKAISRFTIEPSVDEGFLLHIEDEDGETVEYSATAEQLDLIAEAIDEHLMGDMEDSDLVDDEVEE